MRNLNNGIKSSLDSVLFFVPKLTNFYKPIGEHMFAVLLPMGLLSIADYACKKGHSVEVLHFGLEKINDSHFLLKDYLKQTNPKVVGLSLHWHYQCYDTMEIAKQIKAFNPDIFIVLGGLTAGYFSKEILEEFDSIDAVIRGDGEIPFSKLLEEIVLKDSNFSTVPNLVWRKQNSVEFNENIYVAKGEDLDKFNFTNLKLLKNYQLYIKMKDSRGGRWLKGVNKKINKFCPPPYFPLFIHKGCYFNCSYCGGSKISQRLTSQRNDISIRSIAKVVDSIKEVKKYGYKEIMISYLHFANYPNYFEELFQAVKKEKINMGYFLECWVLPTKSVVENFKDLCGNNSKSYIGISPETGSDNIRKLNKGFYYPNSELVEKLDYINFFKIPVILYFSLGLPFENIQDIKITLRFQELLRKKFKNIIGISTVNPVLEPASPMYLEPEKYGIVKTRSSFKDFVQSSKDINKLGFITPKLGYFKRDFCKSKRFKCFSQEDTFRRDLQRIICRSSCRLSDFIFSIFPIMDTRLIRRLISPCLRLICGILPFYWKLNLAGGKEYKNGYMKKN